MSKIYLSLAALCLFALYGVINAAENGPSCHNYNRKEVIAAARSAIQTCDEVLELYNEIVDHFYINGDEMASVIGNLKAGLTNGIDLYEKSPKAVIEWCSRVSPLLAAYKDGASTSKENLLKELGDVTPIAKKVQDALNKSGQNINTAGRNLLNLEGHLTKSFVENHRYIMDYQKEAMKTQVPELKKKVATIREFVEDFACTQDKVYIAFADTASIKELADVASKYVPSDVQPGKVNSITDTVNHLINDCAAYQEKYD